MKRGGVRVRFTSLLRGVHFFLQPTCRRHRPGIPGEVTTQAAGRDEVKGKGKEGNQRERGRLRKGEREGKDQEVEVK